MKPPALSPWLQKEGSQELGVSTPKDEHRVYVFVDLEGSVLIANLVIFKLAKPTVLEVYQQEQHEDHLFHGITSNLLMG